MSLVFEKVGPVIVLIVLNYKIYRRFQNHQIELIQTRLRSSLLVDVLNIINIRMTRISIVIVGVFIICHLPRIIPTLFDLTWGNDKNVNTFLPV